MTLNAKGSMYYRIWADILLFRDIDDFLQTPLHDNHDDILGWSHLQLACLGLGVFYYPHFLHRYRQLFLPSLHHNLHHPTRKYVQIPRLFLRCSIQNKHQNQCHNNPLQIPKKDMSLLHVLVHVPTIWHFYLQNSDKIKSNNLQ